MNPLEVTRPIWWNVPDWLAAGLYATAALTLGFSVWMAGRHLASWRRARPFPIAGRFDLRQGLFDLASEVLAHRKVFRDPVAAVAHLLIFYGFVVLFLGTVSVFIHDKIVPFLFGRTYLVFKFTLNLFGAFFIVGLGMAVFRRYARAPGRLTNDGQAAFMLVLLLVIGVSGFALEAARIATTWPPFEAWSFVGYALASGLRALGLTPEGARGLHRILWAFHALASGVFFASLIVTRFRHMFAGPANILLRSARPLGALEPVPDAPPAGRVGAAAPEDLTWRQLLDGAACIQCGRCQAVCPATLSGKPLNPRTLILKAQRAAAGQAGGGAADLHAEITPEEIWACTTCAACVYECPFTIEVPDKITELRRSLVDGGAIDEAGARALEGILERGNPWGQPPSRRTEWLGGAPVRIVAPGEAVDVLYWVGCAGAFDPAGQGVTRAVVGLLRQAGVDFGILGVNERCTGDPARRMGDEALFEEAAREVIGRLGAVRFRRLLTHCAHCYHTFRNEYPRLGPALPVIHHSQFLSELLAQGRLRPAGSPGRRTTFHDACYLGRYNGEFEAPRQALAALPGLDLAEMGRTRGQALCCGAGGGGNWIDVRIGRRVAALRLEDAEAVGAEVIATACPFCKIMLEGETASRASGPRPQVRDIAELLAEAQGQGR